jgi:hypothetical protein
MLSTSPTQSYLQKKRRHPEIAAQAALISGASIDFYGDGVMLESLSAEFGSERCRFFGFVSDPWRLISEDSVLVVPSEYEGDGMTVVEGILNNNPILLADNADLRRFKLPDRNYFGNLKELSTKIQEVKVQGFEDFRPPHRFVTNLRDERDITYITSRWVEKLKEISNEIE